MRVAHIGVAVRNAEAALHLYRDVLGLKSAHVETVEAQKVKTVQIPVGSTSIELLEPISPDSLVARFIEKRGEGIHHLALEVPNVQAALDQMKAAGYRLIDEKPRLGANNMLIAFVHPEAANGVLLELCQRATH
jgi:lactoylglutathione lyase/methylmalonyl-CoA/ethylmalonyl-CoA epimerase